jgi:hypothetical protein
VIGELDVFIKIFLRYIEFGGLHAPVIGGLDVFIHRILRYIDSGGRHAR